MKKTSAIHNHSLRERLHRVIPGGAHTYSRGDDQFPSMAPALLKRGKGAYVFDMDENRFLDYGMALRSVTIGYADERVNSAAIAEIENGVGLTRASMTELQAAERLADVVPSVEMVKFAKNGSNATTAALKIARAYTGRDYVCIPKQHPFFSFDDWFIGTTEIKRGVDRDRASKTLTFDFNDLASLQRLFDQYPDQIAAVMLEPTTHVTPAFLSDHDRNWQEVTYDKAGVKCPSFLTQVRELTSSQGSLLIFDEMITGFRWHLSGAQEFFGVEPDLSTFGKAMANGFALAAVGGRSEIMEVGSIDKPNMERTFLLSSTHGAEMPALGAFLAASKICEEENVPAHIWNFGLNLKNGLNNLANEYGLGENFEVEGPPVALNYVTRDKEGAPSAGFRTLFAQEMLKKGVLIPWISISLSHGEEELEFTLSAAREAFEIYRKAVDADSFEDYLAGPPIKPVFRKYN
ncbi:glutamate-1-semialdehyde 2,1-aminomutase [Maritalea sp. S77]|uniref:glutamate-1-semialdehyde 2,1-aminomutase n=1 Tax=Maritalea sp. S77 TaxID=3415125 RepID=UPI003C7B4D62